MFRRTTITVVEPAVHKAILLLRIVFEGFTFVAKVVKNPFQQTFNG